MRRRCRVSPSPGRSHRPDPAPAPFHARLNRLLPLRRPFCPPRPSPPRSRRPRWLPRPPRPAFPAAPKLYVESAAIRPVVSVPDIFVQGCPCRDAAFSGKHYGVLSCDGCRGFFKRSIRRNLEYQCKEGGNCVVDVARRNQCQACRFSKCIQVAMNRDETKTAKPLVGCHFSIERLTALSPRAESPASGGANSHDWLGVLKSAVQWARSIPPFRQLPSADRRLLLEHTWHHVFLLSVAQSEGDPRWQEWQSDNQSMEANRIRRFLQGLSQLQINANEASCLKAVLLFKHETAGLISPSVVRSVQEQALLMLADYCTATSTQMNSGGGGLFALTNAAAGGNLQTKLRFAKLLLLLPGLWLISVEHVSRMFLSDVHGGVQSFLDA
uniref:Nuclear receptor domain-containing protein n=1 Tax=Plectus sambesii TaxID=2011161 RepID=A0A914UWW4_9BILA